LALMMLAHPAASEPLRLHLAGGAARAVAGHQQHEFGWGATGLGGMELPLHSLVGVELAVGALWLSEGETPKDATLAPQEDATAYDGTLGLRFHPLAPWVSDSSALKQGGLWFAVRGGAGTTDEAWRAVFRSEVGLDFAVLNRNVGIGPFAGYQHVFQPNDTLRPDDANVLLVGIHAVFDPWRKPPPPAAPPPPPPRPQAPTCPGAPGCPVPDRDRDGIPDGQDACPDDPEDKDGYLDEDGCPDGDNDQDAFPDAQDQCPGEPETVNGYADDDGCPDEQQVRVVGDKIVLDDKIHFDTLRSKIRPASYPIIQRLANLLKKRPEYVHVEIQGHADERGSNDANQSLSEERANAVRERLIQEGVDAGRLSSVGFGESRPWFKASTPGVWFLNRRVEFVITRNKRGQTQPPPVSAPAAPGSGSSVPNQQSGATSSAPPTPGAPPPAPTTAPSESPPSAAPGQKPAPGKHFNSQDP
jgi:outer membrane protein OmpA-like peptidoglycan-associated protein